MLRSLFFASIAAAFTAQPALAQTNAGGSRTPTLIEVPLGEDAINVFVMGDRAFGDVFQEIAALRALPADRNEEIANSIWERRSEAEPIFLMEAARRYATFNEERALYAYFLGRSRVIYDARRCADSTALESVEVVDQFAQSEIAPLMADVGRVHDQLSAVYSSGETFTSTTSPWWICSSSNSAFFAAQNGATLTEAEWLRVPSLWPGIQDSMNNNMLANIRVFAAAAEEE